MRLFVYRTHWTIIQVVVNSFFNILDLEQTPLQENLFYV